MRAGRVGYEGSEIELVSTDKLQYQVTVKGLVFDELGQVLLMHESSGVWDLPGGRLEHGEDFHAALKRECQEEMGLDCEVLDTHPHWAWPVKGGDGIWKVVLCFRMRLPHLNFVASDECVNLGFFNCDALHDAKLTLQIRPLATHLATMQSTMRPTILPRSP